MENVREKTRFHPRCGTSFMILMLLVGVIVGMLIPQTGAFTRTLVKLLCLPLIMGLGYELLKLCGKYDNAVTRIIATPGLWMQRLTTKEPDDDQIEVAVCAFVAAAPQNELTEEMKAIALYYKTKNDVIQPVENLDGDEENEETEATEVEGAELNRSSQDTEPGAGEKEVKASDGPSPAPKPNEAM